MPKFSDTPSNKRPDHPPTSHGGRVIEAEPSQETQPVTDTTAAIPVPATFGDYEYDRTTGTGRVDGVVVPVEVEYDPAAPEIGILTGEWRAYVALGDARLVDRGEWNEAHPGVEPTPAAMQAVVAAARHKIERDAEDQAADAADYEFDPEGY